MRTAAVIVAAGKGLRMGGDIPKQYLPLAGRPVLAHTLAAFENSSVDEIVVVCGEGDEEHVRSEIAEKYGITKLSAVVRGGRERFDSSYRGILRALGLGSDGCTSSGSDVTHVLIHDGVRCLITPEDIDRVIASLTESPAVIPAVPVKDTVRRISTLGIMDDTRSLDVVPRSDLVLVQTPQAFEASLLMEAYSRFYGEAEEDPSILTGITDDAMLIERYTTAAVKIVSGSYRNIKITTPEDLIVAEAYLNRK